MLNDLLAGAIMLNAWAIAVFFLRYWRRTHDALFACFAIAFLLLGIERLSLVILTGETHFRLYFIRLAAFIMIIFAIWLKNRATKSG